MITRFGIFWLSLRVLFSQLDLQLAFLNGRLVLLCRCQIFESHGVARLAPESALKFGDRLIVSTFLIEKHPEVVVRKEMFRLERDGAAVLLDRFIKPVEPLVCVREIKPGRQIR